MRRRDIDWSVGDKEQRERESTCVRVLCLCICVINTHTRIGHLSTSKVHALRECL
jgi:hypothetical protein